MSDQAADGELVCLGCKQPIAGELERCDHCGYSLDGVRLYNPKHFVWLAILFSGLVPIFLAALNYGRTGQNRRKWQWLALGFLLFATIFAVLSFLPNTGSGVGKVFGYAVNLPLGFAVRSLQLPLYRAGLRLGAAKASTLVGSVFGIGFAVLTLIVPFGVVSAVYLTQFEQGRHALEGGRCEEAASSFERLYTWDSEDFDAMFNLALCYACLERWEESAELFQRYVQEFPDDAWAHSFLGDCLHEQGRVEEAEKHHRRAEELDPSVLQP